MTAMLLPVSALDAQVEIPLAVGGGSVPVMLPGLGIQINRRPQMLLTIAICVLVHVDLLLV